MRHLRLSAATSLIALLGCATTSLIPAPVPNYDTENSCHRLGVAAGGSALVELTCRKQEETAKVWLSSHTTSRRIGERCQKLGDAAGGILNVIRTCIEQEEKAQAELYRQG